MLKKALCSITLIALMLTSVLIANTPAAYAATEVGLMKVRITPSQYAGTLKFRANGLFTLADKQLDANCYYTAQASGTNVVIKDASGNTVASGAQLTLKRDSSNTAANRIIVPSAPNHSCECHYLGDMEFSVNRGLCIVSCVDIDTYVLGVLPYEMSSSWHVEALKAQAVAARSYGVTSMSGGSTAAWNIGDTASDQVYRGFPYAEFSASGQTAYNNLLNAVNGTSRQVMTYNGKVIRAYFSAWNGGETLNAKGWTGNTGAEYGYLTVGPDTYDDLYAKGYWRTMTLSNDLVGETGFSKAQVDAQDKLRALIAGKVVRALGGDTSKSAVEIVSAGAFVGVPKNGESQVKLVFPSFNVNVNYKGTLYNGGNQSVDASMTVNLSASELKTLPAFAGSSYSAFRIENKGDAFTLNNVRYGHGVGLSQRGAHEMARRGKGYAEILNYYYSGIAFTQLSGSGSIPGAGTAVPTAQPTQAPTSGSYPATVNCMELVNVRSQPSTSAAILGQFKNGDKITVTVKNYAASWHQIQFNGQTAYIHSSYVTFDPASTPTTVVAKGRTVGTTLVRKTPGGAVIAQLKAGVIVDVTKRDYTADWHQVKYSGALCYVHRSNLTFETAPVAVSPFASGKAAKAGSLFKSANSKSQTLKAVPKGAVLQLRGKSGSYYQVYYSGKLGYMPVSGVSLTKGPVPGTADYMQTASAKAATYLYSVKSLKGKRLLTIEKGAALKVVDTSSSSYYKVNYGRKTGYVVRSQFTLISIDRKATVGSSATLYQSGSTGAKKLKTIGANKAIAISGYYKGFAKVSYSGTTGYVELSKVKFK